jgi:hypothetical protein
MDNFMSTQNVEQMWMILIMDSRINATSSENVQEIKQIFKDNITPFSKYKFETTRIKIDTQQQLDQLNDAFVRTIFRFISSKCPHLIVTQNTRSITSAKQNVLLPITSHSQSATQQTLNPYVDVNRPYSASIGPELMSINNRDDFLQNNTRAIESAYTKKMHEYENTNARTIPNQPKFADDNTETPVDMERAVKEAISRRNYDVPIVSIQQETNQPNLKPKQKITMSSFQLNEPKPDDGQIQPIKYLTLGSQTNALSDATPIETLKQISWGENAIIIETNEFEISIKNRKNNLNEFNSDKLLLELDKLLKIII